MAQGTRNITIRFLGNTTGLSSALGGASKDVRRFSASVGGSLAGLSGRVKIAAAAFAALGAGAALKGFINGARESAKVGRLTAAVIKSTGGVAGVSADQVGKLASAISAKTGADDEAIQSGENLLLTFTGIRNGVGAGNQIFDQAAATITDMAAALNNGDVSASGLKSSAIQLGKALNDPVKGVTALSKVGVSFTEGQKKQIKKLVETGNALDAQRIILGELSTEFGGAAAASSDAFDKLHTSLGNIGEDIGGLLLGPVSKLATVIDTKAVPKIRDLIASIAAGDEPFGSLQRGLQSAGETVQKYLLPPLQTLGQRIADAAPGLAKLATALAPALAPAAVALIGLVDAVGLLALGLGKVGDFFGSHTTVVGAFAAAVGALAVGIAAVTAASAVCTAVTGGLVTAFWALDAAISANPIGITVVALATLAAGLVYAWKTSQRFREVVAGAFNGVKDAVFGSVKTLVSVTGQYFDFVLGGFQKLLEGLGHLPKFLGGGAFDHAAEALQSLRNNVAAAVDGINANLSRIQQSITVDVRIRFVKDVEEVGVSGADLRAVRNEKDIAAARAARIAEADAKAAKAAKQASDALRNIAPPPIPAIGGGAAATTKAVKQARKTGREVLDGFLGGLSSRFPAADAALQSWSDRLPVRLGHGLDAVVKSAEANLTRLQKALDANKSRLDKANTTLDDARSKLRDYASGVRDAVTALGDLGTHGGGSFEVIRDRLAQTLGNARDFAATMAQLKGAGLSASGLQQLVAAGPGLATVTGKALLAGGKAGIAQINAMQTQLDRLGAKTGAALGNQFFAQGVKQAEGVVAGLKSRQKQLEAQMTAAGKALAAAVVAGLGLRVTKQGTVAHRAAGGPVTAGRSYLVGELGPELFRPRTAGTVVANHALAAGGGGPIVIENHIEIGGEVVRVVRSEISTANRATRARVLAGAGRGL